MISRRKFMAQSALLTVGALAAGSCVSARPKTNRVGIQLYSLRDELPKDVRTTIKKVADAGYAEVETYGYSTKGGFWGLSAKEFKSLLTYNGLSTPSGHYSLDQFLGDGSLENLKRDIEACQITGQKYFTVPFLNEKFRKTSDDLKALAEKFNRAATLCKQEGLQMAYHNHDFEFKTVGNTSLYTTLLDQVDKSLLLFEMDLYWVVRAGEDPVKWMEKYPGRFVMVHIKDMDKNQPQLNTEVGSGSIDFKPIVAKAELAGIKHLIVEQENFSMDPYQSIAQSYNYVKNSLLK